MRNVSKAKKLVSVLATSALMTGASKEAQEVIVLDWVPCIYYPVQFQQDQRATIQVLSNYGSKVNVMTLAYAKQLGFQIRKTDVGT